MVTKLVLSKYLPIDLLTNKIDTLSNKTAYLHNIFLSSKWLVGAPNRMMNPATK
jgi:hypothetical protein